MPRRFMQRVFLLSPASCSGKRARILLRPEADFDLARRLREGGASLAEVFAFLSGLYFRGKVAYASRFAVPPPGVPGALCITSNRGLLELDRRLTDRDVADFDTVEIDPRNAAYERPLLAAATRLAERLSARVEIVLLGSVATPKYAGILLPIFGERLRFPESFAGRGDMSRGGLMLRAVREGRELEYAAVELLRPRRARRATSGRH